MKGSSLPVKKNVDVIEMTHTEAKVFFLKNESYFNGDLPSYFDFSKLLISVEKILGTKKLSDFEGSPKARDSEGVNHQIFANKDGKLSWRPIELIHPTHYVNLVRSLTEKDNWDKLKTRLSVLSLNPQISCQSVPLSSNNAGKDKAAQINRWWHDIELRSIELSLKYDLLYETDIADCYGSIYTHSIAWAVEGKEVAKEPKNRNNNKLIGVFIDKSIQTMRQGQTNGIPQGSVLMDFIAELVLAYVDSELTKKITNSGIEDYQILRYRDDYKIFVNDSRSAEKILKYLSETLLDLGLKLNSAKTKSNADVVLGSVKQDKLAWLKLSSDRLSLLKHSLLIKDYSTEYPNTGGVTTALSKFNNRVSKLSKADDSTVALIAVIVDVAYRNPRTYPFCFAIISKLLSLLEPKRRVEIVEKMRSRFSQLPNVGNLEIWMQRALKNYEAGASYSEPLCKVVSGDQVKIWNSSWISSTTLKNTIDSMGFIDQEKLKKLPTVIASIEVELFKSAYY